MSTFNVRSETTICATEPPNPSFSKLRLLMGNLWINVNRMLKDGSMEVELNQAVCGIKGTTFELWETGGVSVLKVMGGVVTWRNKATGQTIQVRAGQTWSSTVSELVRGDARSATGYWQFVGTGDCPGRDVANSRGPDPASAKCYPQFIGRTAVCWDRECTYKNIETSACVGGANPGRMYTCVSSRESNPYGTSSWRFVGTGDCPGRDVANSWGPNPDPVRCNRNFNGQTAICWKGQCTYKNIATGSCTGGSNPGRMYTCEGSE